VPGDPDYVWPFHFPEDCPPVDAVPCSGVVFRLVAGEPPGPGDFLSWRDEGKGEGLEGDQLCRTCGLSVNRELADAKKLLARMRKKVPGYRNNFVASGELVPRAGKIKPTPSRLAGRSHCTWWVPAGFRPWVDLDFKLVA
jgi:hypothetical protein